MSLRTLWLSAVLSTVLSIGPAFAKDHPPLQLDSIRTQQANIREGVLARNGRYRNLSEETRSELIRKQDFILRTIEGKESPDQLSEAQRLEVFNALEWMEAAINKTNEERLICRREKTTGSNMPTRVCKTEAQMREEQEEARRVLNERPHGMR